MIVKFYQTEKEFILVSRAVQFTKEQIKYELDKFDLRELKQTRELFLDDDINQGSPNALEALNDAIAKFGAMREGMVQKSFNQTYNYVYGHDNPPTTAPKKIGDQWVDIRTKHIYVAFGDEDVSDWIEVYNNADTGGMYDKSKVLIAISGAETGDKYMLPDGSWKDIPVLRTRPETIDLLGGTNTGDKYLRPDGTWKDALTVDNVTMKSDGDVGGDTVVLSEVPASTQSKVVDGTAVTFGDGHMVATQAGIFVQAGGKLKKLAFSAESLGQINVGQDIWNIMSTTSNAAIVDGYQNASLTEGMTIYRSGGDTSGQYIINDGKARRLAFADELHKEVAFYQDEGDNYYAAAKMISQVDSKYIDGGALGKAGALIWNYNGIVGYPMLSDQTGTMNRMALYSDIPEVSTIAGIEKITNDIQAVLLPQSSLMSHILTEGSTTDTGSQKAKLAYDKTAEKLYLSNGVKWREMALMEAIPDMQDFVAKVSTANFTYMATQPTGNVLLVNGATADAGAGRLATSSHAVNKGIYFSDGLTWNKLIQKSDLDDAISSLGGNIDVEVGGNTQSVIQIPVTNNTEATSGKNKGTMSAGMIGYNQTTGRFYACDSSSKIKHFEFSEDISTHVDTQDNEALLPVINDPLKITGSSSQHIGGLVFNSNTNQLLISNTSKQYQELAWRSEVLPQADLMKQGEHSVGGVDAWLTDEFPKFNSASAANGYMNAVLGTGRMWYNDSLNTLNYSKDGIVNQIVNVDMLNAQFTNVLMKDGANQYTTKVVDNNHLDYVDGKVVTTEESVKLNLDGRLFWNYNVGTNRLCAFAGGIVREFVFKGDLEDNFKKTDIVGGTAEPIVGDVPIGGLYVQWE